MSMRCTRYCGSLPCSAQIEPLNGMWRDIREREDRNVQSEWLTPNEAAQYLKVKPRTLLQWARERRIPAHRLSGIERCIWRFLRSELDAMLAVSSADSADGRQH